MNFHYIGFGYKNNQNFLESRKLYVPHTKGGSFRKWYGNNEHILNFDQKSFNELEESGNHLPSRQFYFQEGCGYTRISSSLFSIRYNPTGFVFNFACPTLFCKTQQELFICLGLLSSKLVNIFVSAISPTLNFQAGEIRQIPFVTDYDQELCTLIKETIHISRKDWDSYERSWDFETFPLLDYPAPTIETSYHQWIAKNREAITEMKRLEEENNRLFIDAYGLQDELTPDVPIQQITLTVNPAYRYSKDLSDQEWSVANGFGKDLETRFCQDTSKELISYALGCIMGRYSLDRPGLIYAHSENKDFDPSQYATFPADEDGIIPLTDSQWFTDDAVNRLVEFVATAYSPIPRNIEGWKFSYPRPSPSFAPIATGQQQTSSPVP